MGNVSSSTHSWQLVIVCTRCHNCMAFIIDSKLCVCVCVDVWMCEGSKNTTMLTWHFLIIDSDFSRIYSSFRQERMQECKNAYKIIHWTFSKKLKKKKRRTALLGCLYDDNLDKNRVISRKQEADKTRQARLSLTILKFYPPLLITFVIFDVELLQLNYYCINWH